MLCVAKLGGGLGLGRQKLGNMKVILVNGDDLASIKEKFDGNMGLVVMGRTERSAFRPTKRRGSASTSSKR
jgi:hypothetical protein